MLCQNHKNKLVELEKIRKIIIAKDNKQRSEHEMSSRNQERCINCKKKKKMRTTIDALTKMANKMAVNN